VVRDRNKIINPKLTNTLRQSNVDLPVKIDFTLRLWRYFIDKRNVTNTHKNGIINQNKTLFCPKTDVKSFMDISAPETISEWRL
jgi:hypothetical protein